MKKGATYTITFDIDGDQAQGDEWDSIQEELLETCRTIWRSNGWAVGFWLQRTSAEDIS